MPLTQEIQMFILNEERWTNRNRWFEISKLKVYMRRGTHYIDEKFVQCIDVASVEVEEDVRGEGRFTHFLEDLEAFLDKERPDLLIYVENVLEARFQDFFKRRLNYEQCNPPNICFLRKPKDSS